MIDYNELADQVLDTGGFTTDIVTGAQPIRGYVVGTRPDSEQALHLGPGATRKDVADFIYSYVVHHGYDLREGYLLGGWRDGDTVVLDLVQLYHTRSGAMAQGKQFGQDAIYHLDSQQVINL